MKSVYMDEFISDDESEDTGRMMTIKHIDKEQYEQKKSDFNLKKLMSQFILKKDYFISHKTTDIFLDYDIDEQPIGEGAFGVVYKGKEKTTGLVRAIKQIFNENITNYDGFMTEVSALKTLDHPNVVKLYEVYQDSKCVFLVLEYLDGGELFDYITDNDHLDEAESAQFFKQMMSSIIYCHKNRICHRDLKPDNFMLANKEDKSLKLIDFGLSRSFYRFQGDGKGEFIRMETKVGTSLYMAPEVLQKNYTSACDTWSLGVILFIMLCGCPPFDGDEDSEIFSAILNQEFDFGDETWDDVSEDAKDLITNILVDEKKRLTPKECLSHKWVKQHCIASDKPLVSMSHVDRMQAFQNSNNLKKAILTFLATKATDKDIKEEMEVFNQFDKNKDGYITTNELKKGLKDIQKYSDEDLDNIMQSLDTDNNGAINYNEFIAATLNSKVSHDVERISKAFEFFDLDNDGLIDENELKNALAGKEFEKIDISIFSEALKECDQDGDGKVDYKEFLSVMESKLAEKVSFD
jgi:calcium-dependent protein kinase